MNRISKQSLQLLVAAVITSRNLNSVQVDRSVVKFLGIFGIILSTVYIIRQVSNLCLHCRLLPL